jgi:hypothetical protein
MAITPTTPADAQAANAPCGQCSKCLNASGEKVELFAGIFVPVAGARMVLCQICGNKRCPHAADCALACTDSNEPGQPGSNYANQPGYARIPQTEVEKQKAREQDLAERALALYSPPFRVVEGAIYDSAGHKVADDREGVMRVRGWGRIAYMENADQLQDAVGQMLADALNDYWRANTPMVADSPSKELSRPPADPAGSKVTAMRLERDTLRERLAVLDAALAGDAKRLPVAPTMPHPKCDEACYYHCTEGGTRPPSCIAIAAEQAKVAAEEVQAAAGAEGLPPPDYYMSEQHGTLKLSFTDQVDDGAYRWRGVWLQPVYEQNATIRQKAAQYDDLVDRLTGSVFDTPARALHAAIQVSGLSDELIVGICNINGMATVPQQYRIKAVRDILRTVGVEPPRS